MTPRTVVKKTLTFDKPSRIPRQLWWTPWSRNHYPEQFEKIKADFPDDIVGCPWFFAGEVPMKGDPYEVGYYTDEWGCTFENKQKGIIGEVKDPLVKDWSDLDKVHPPEVMLTLDIDKANEACRASDKFMQSGCCPRPFERLQFLRGTENLMMDLALRPPELFELIKIVHGHYLKEIEQWMRTEVDALMFMDDWGAQRSLLISPATWREIFKPMYKEYIDLARSRGKFVLMHSDGYILDIYPDLIELGVNALNSQIFCMGVEELGKRFRGKITFWGEVDRQNLLPNGTVAQVEAAAKLMYQHLWADGGLIGECEFGPGAKPENVYKAYETWSKIKPG